VPHGGNIHGVNEKLGDLLPFLQGVDVRLLQADFISAYFIPGHALL
jgi:hypothetical protein